MPLWRIVPAADPRDPRWQGRPIWREVIVRAPSAALARLLAARLDSAETVPAGNESLGPRSGFSDEKLYWLRRLDDAASAGLGSDNGRDGILRAVPWDEAPE